MKNSHYDCNIYFYDSLPNPIVIYPQWCSVATSYFTLWYAFIIYTFKMLRDNYSIWLEIYCSTISLNPGDNTEIFIKMLLIQQNIYFLQFYISLGLRVGGVNDFADDLPEKPWTNRGRKAMLDFWRQKDTWHQTWYNTNMKVDYVKVYALWYDSGCDYTRILDCNKIFLIKFYQKLISHWVVRNLYVFIFISR